MIYGLRTKSAAGVVELDENSFTVRVIYSELVPRSAGYYVDIPIPQVDPANCQSIVVPAGPYTTDPNAQDAYAIQFEPQTFEGFVRVWFTNRNITGNQPSSGLATQRLLVMRYK